MICTTHISLEGLKFIQNNSEVILHKESDYTHKCQLKTIFCPEKSISHLNDDCSNKFFIISFIQLNLMYIKFILSSPSSVFMTNILQRFPSDKIAVRGIFFIQNCGKKKSILFCKHKYRKLFLSVRK